MGSRDYLKLGDWNIICDRCGAKFKASECRFDWQNLLVCDNCWEPRHPQDFVKGIPDNQSVPFTRPDITQTMGETTVETTALKNATTIDLVSITGLSKYDPIGIALDNGITHWTYIDGTPSAASTPLGDYLTGNATAGNTVYLPSINNDTYVTATSVLASEL